MPYAAARPCAGGCGVLVRAPGRCPACSRVTRRGEQQRWGTSTERGFDQNWIRFRRHFLAELVACGITPVCGAALPDGPRTQDSYCRRLSVLTFTSATGSSLHLDHEPPLRECERHDVYAVCDKRRIQLLCASCHARKDDTFRPVEVV